MFVLVMLLHEENLNVPYWYSYFPNMTPQGKGSCCFLTAGHDHSISVLQVVDHTVLVPKPDFVISFEALGTLLLSSVPQLHHLNKKGERLT